MVLFQTPPAELTIKRLSASRVYEGQLVTLEATLVNPEPKNLYRYYFYKVKGGGPGELLSDREGMKGEGEGKDKITVTFDWVTERKDLGEQEVMVVAKLGAGAEPKEISSKDPARVEVLAEPLDQRVPTPVTMTRTRSRFTPDLLLWEVIKRSSEAISFDNYLRFMDILFCPTDLPPGAIPKDPDDPDRRLHPKYRELKKKRSLPFNDTDAYRLVKVATEAFLMVHCGVTVKGIIGNPNGPAGVELDEFLVNDPTIEAEIKDLLRGLSIAESRDDLPTEWVKKYLKVFNGGMEDRTIPYLALVRNKLPDVLLKDEFTDRFPEDRCKPEVIQSCFGILREKLTKPCLLELIWSYWHEEGMLVQTMNALSLRFQNVRNPGANGVDPLANLEIDPLRPLNNIIWGYIQDEQHRLTMLRRAYEYDHHYGLTLQGKAVPKLRTADSRSKFLEAFHNLLYHAVIFYKEDDDTTVVADGFPILNALKEIHIILAEGAHNQFGDLPSTARQEMLMQQWVLARPEFREFLPTRIMVAYPERWMDRVDAMKHIQGWTDTSILHFRNLGVFGERVLLSIRYGAWSNVDDPAQAANWARFWRAEIQGYIHAYRAATGVDLSMEITDTRLAAQRYLPPSVHLRQRLALQRQRR